MTLTKIIATLGPASNTPETVQRLIEEGARVFRINFSHGSPKDFERLLNVVRHTADSMNTSVAVLGDLSGPKIRLGRVREGGVMLEPGAIVEFQHEPVVVGDNDLKPQHPDAILVSCTAPDAIDDVQIGQRLLIDDGAIRLLAVDRLDSNRRLICHVVIGGRISSSKGINLPDTKLSLPSITEHDEACARWAVEHELDYLALSFVRRAQDVRALRKFLAGISADAARTPIVAKIEKPQAIDDLEAIVDEVDAVMVARGDLGVEMELAQVPVIQKRIIETARLRGKPVIVATQMLQSMIDVPMPTRAEVSDVANAIYDGTDAVMLSGETAVGKHPVRAVHMMAQIALATQAHVAERPVKLPELLPRDASNPHRPASVTRGVVNIVNDVHARLVAIWTQSGAGAQYLARNRMSVPIVAASPNHQALRRMCLLFGVIPIWMPDAHSSEAFAEALQKLVLERDLAQIGDSIVFVLGNPFGVEGLTNSIWVHQIGDVCRL